MTEDDELRVTAAVAVQRRDELVAEGKPELADYMNELACAAAELRDQRRALAREVDDAMVPSLSLGILEDQDDGDPERDARLAAAVAEWQAGRARPAPTVIRCPAGHATSLRLLETSVGLVLVGDAPLAAGRGMATHPIRFVTLVEDAGSYDVGCTRCKAAFRLELAAVRRAVAARATMYRAT